MAEKTDAVGPPRPARLAVPAGLVLLCMVVIYLYARLVSVRRLLGGGEVLGVLIALAIVGALWLASSHFLWRFGIKEKLAATTGSYLAIWAFSLLTWVRWQDGLLGMIYAPITLFMYVSCEWLGTCLD